MWASLLDLREAIERDGLEAVATVSLMSPAETCLDLQAGLEADLVPQRADRWGSWRVQFECVIDATTTHSWVLEWDGTVASCVPGGSQDYSASLRADMDKMLYICSGTQAVNTNYVGKILLWWRAGDIVAHGNLMLVQDLQRMFG
jgi:hypothetical protein